MVACSCVCFAHAVTLNYIKMFTEKSESGVSAEKSRYDTCGLTSLMATSDLGKRMAASFS